MTISRLLAFNLGSTTLKAAAFDVRLHEPGADAEPVERTRSEHPLGAQGDAHARLDAVLAALHAGAEAPDVVVHRIVHGGERRGPRVLDDALLAELDTLVALAPDHQPGALALARVARLRWPHARHVVAFDTDFHAHLAPWSRRLPIPADWAARGLRRYGFHGLAFASDLRQVGAVAPSILRGRAVLAHLGGGCSVCAVDGGRSVDTTMSATPTSGLPGPTRSGDLDPAVVLQMLRYDGGDAAAVAARLAHASGLAGIAGTGDLRALLADDRADAVLAVDQFVMRTTQAIAAMATAIGGLEHLVFSGGSGHRSPVLRACIVRQLEWVGLALDADRNDSGAMLISAPMTPSIWNVDVDEELELALGACAALRAGRAASHPVRGL